MLKAIVDGVLSNSLPQSRGKCPSCGSDVIAKCGKTVVWHWAHTSCVDCDDWGEPETEWHAAWKSRFSETEKTIRRESDWHRADAVSPAGVVIEFQHSTITAAVVAERELFYKNMIWVVDAAEAFLADRIGLDHRRPDDGREFCRFRWKHRRRSFDECTAPLFIDLGVSFVTVGEPFYRSERWWDDVDGGLRDGVARSEGVWQRIAHKALLIEVKKKSGARGWGRILTHDEFCGRYGALNCVSPQPYTGLLRIWGNNGGDGYEYFTHTSCRQADRISGAYSWCEYQLTNGVEK
jgi:hypothetical protein